MEMALSDVAHATDMLVERDGTFSSLGYLQHERPLQLCYLEGEAHVEECLSRSNITCVITTPDVATRLPSSLGVAVTEEPRAAFFSIHQHLYRETEFYGTTFQTEIAGSAIVHPRAFVASTNVRIGDGCLIEPNATVLENSILDDRVTVRAGAVIGSQGFEFKRFGEQLVPVPHAGGVHLREGAEVQSNACVDRGVFGGSTLVGRDSKVDNLVHVAHDVQIGDRCLIVAGAMIAGSVIIEDDSWIGPMASISSGVRVGAGAFVTLGSVVTRDVPPNGHVTGYFAVPHDRFLTFIRSIR